MSSQLFRKIRWSRTNDLYSFQAYPHSAPADSKPVERAEISSRDMARLFGPELAEQIQREADNKEVVVSLDQRLKASKQGDGWLVETPSGVLERVKDSKDVTFEEALVLASKQFPELLQTLCAKGVVSIFKPGETPLITVADLIDYLQQLDAPEMQVLLTRDEFDTPTDTVLLDMVLDKIEDSKASPGKRA